MYTCLVGKPPYEAKDVKATYQRILANEYRFPKDATFSSDAKDLIYCMLQSKPLDRPTLKEIELHPFFTCNAIPVSLPSNATHVAPQWEKMSDSSSSVGSGFAQKKVASRPALPKSNSQRRPFGSRDANVDPHSHRGSKREEKVLPATAPTPTAASIPREKERPTTPMIDVQGAVKNAFCAVASAATSMATASPHASSRGGFQVFDESASAKKERDLIARTSNLDLRSPRGYCSTPAASREDDALTLNRMFDRISTVLDVVSQRSYNNVYSDSQSLTPLKKGGPSKWVSRYVDYTSKYGLGYLLNDGRYACHSFVCLVFA